MKKLLFLLLLISTAASAQVYPGQTANNYYFTGSLSVGQGTANLIAHSSALLQLGKDTTKKGFLMARGIRDSVSNPKKGLLFWDVRDKSLYHYNGSVWVKFLTMNDARTFNILDYGADTSTDNQLPIQKTILAAYGWELVGTDTDNNYDTIRQVSLYEAGDVYTPIGRYEIRGALKKKVVHITIQGDTIVKNINSQLYIPYSRGVGEKDQINPNSISFTWQGRVMPGLAHMTETRNHNNWHGPAHWVSTISSDGSTLPFVLSVVEGDSAFSCCYGSLVYPIFNNPWITVHFDSLDGGTQLGGIDVHWAINGWIYNPRLDVDAEGYSYQNYTHQKTTIGLWLTAPGQGGAIGVDNGWIGGYKYGSYAGEHTVYNHTQITLNNVGVAIAPTTSDHSVMFNNASFHWNQISIMANAPDLPQFGGFGPNANIDGVIDIERNCATALYDIKDTANNLRGSLRYAVSTAGSGPGCTASNLFKISRSGGNILNYEGVITGDIEHNNADSIIFKADLAAGIIGLYASKIAIGTSTNFAPAIDVHLQKTSNANVGVRVENKSSGGSATAVYQMVNDLGNIGVFGKLGSGFAPFSLLNPNDFSIRNSSGGNMVITSAPASSFIDFGAGGSTTTQFRINANGNIGVYNKLLVSSGSNKTAGTATLVGGTVTVANTSVTANSIIFYSRQTTGGTAGHLSITKSNGVSFTINSTSATETSTVGWWIVDTQ